MQTLTLNENILGWDCEILQVTFNGETKEFETLWDMQVYLDHTYGVSLVDEESLIDEVTH